MDLIYCVEDDEGIRDLITYAVKSAGFEARVLKVPQILKNDLASVCRQWYFWI